MSFVVVADWPWPLAFGAGAILLLLARTLWRRKTGGSGEQLPAAPGVGLLGVTFGAAALIIRGTPESLWAGPALGVVASVSTYAYLRRLADRDGRASSS